MNKNHAQIMAVKTDGLPVELPWNNGFFRVPEETIYGCLQDTGAWWGVRGSLEYDDNFKQIIPYIILKRGDTYATYTRGVAGGEQRLHGRVSIGLGGHIDITDMVPIEGFPVTSVKQTIMAAALREFYEEVNLGNETTLMQWNTVGLILNGDDMVNAVHLGVVIEVEVAGNTEITSNEPDLTDMQFLTRDELLAQADRLEAWTAIYLNSIDG